MLDFVDHLRAQIGKTLKASRLDTKTGILTLEFEDSTLNTRLSVLAKNNAFVGLNTTPIKKVVNKKLKAKEEALGDYFSAPKEKRVATTPRKRGKTIAL